MAVLVTLFVTSCHEKNEQLKQSKITLTETTSTQDVLSMLLIETNGDEEVLCRVLNCSKSTLERLHSGKTQPTENADKEIRNLLRISYDEGVNEIYKLDPTDRWFNGWRRAID